MAIDYKIKNSGDQGISVVFGDAISEDINNKVAALKKTIENKNIDGLLSMTASYCALLLNYNSSVINCEQLKTLIINSISEMKDMDEVKGRVHHIPVCYGSVFGPDLDEVADYCKLTKEEVIKKHTEVDYRVYMLGFTPGFPYLGGMDKSIATPRKKQPRLKIEAGSVGIAGEQTGVYPLASPGGWQIIGRTNLRFFDLERDNPFLIEAGDLIKFYSVDHLENDTVKANKEEPTLKSTKPTIEVRQSGMLSTIQDLGRIGFESGGVPRAGAMDEEALIVGNILLGNDRKDAGIELTGFGDTYRFLQDSLIALTGAKIDAEILREYNGTKKTIQIPMWEAIEIRQGDILRLKGISKGLRSYLCVQGGIDVPEVLSSRSTFIRGEFGGHNGRALQKGDILSVGLPGVTKNHSGCFVPKALLSTLRDRDQNSLNVVTGPQDHMFTKEGLTTFFSSKYKATAEIDRMGYRFDGDEIEHIGEADIISDGIGRGAIQVPAHGQPIIMMADAQTTGGYTKIGYVISTDLWKIAQLKQGDAVMFKEISVEKAQNLKLERDQLLDRIEHVIKEQNILPAREFKVAVEQKAFRIRVQEVK